MIVGIYAICKDEMANAEAFYANTQDADVVTICDTGSTDGTLALPRRNNVALHHILVHPWDFSIARNTALALVPSYVDVCIRLDFDERLSPGWRKALEREWRKQPFTQLWYDFVHGKNFTFKANYVHARTGFYWKGIDHEGLFSDTPPAYRYSDDFTITHHQDKSKSRNTLARLERAAKVDPSGRLFWYLGREYYYHGAYHQAVAAFHECTKTSSWVQERMSAHAYISKCYVRLADIQAARMAARKSLLEMPCRISWLAMAESDAAKAGAYRALAASFEPLNSVHDELYLGQ